MDLNKIVDKKEDDKALGTYTENSNKNNKKLETLLSEFFSIINDKATPELWKEGVNGYYNYIYKKINNFDIKNINLSTDDMSLYDTIRDNDDKNQKFGIFLSALINKNVKAGEKVQIIIPIPVNRLFYKLKDSEAHVNIAGEYLGDFAKNSNIYADEAGDGAGWGMEGCELHVRKAGEFIGRSAKNSKIYADEAGDGAGSHMKVCELNIKKAHNYIGYTAKNSTIYLEEAGIFAGLRMENCELHVKKADDKLGYNAKKSVIYADEARDEAGMEMKDCELHVKKTNRGLGFTAKNSRIYADEAGDGAGMGMKNCEMHVKKTTDWLGFKTINSRIYADEAGEGAGGFMQNSQLFIYDLKGNLAGNVLKGNNTIYLGKESYEKFPEYRNKVEIWDKKT